MDANPTQPPQRLADSPWGAFGHPAFAVIWIASTLAQIGIAMYDTASGWLMTSLNADPQAVASVQVAASLPMFLFTLPAGALADIVEPRRFLIIISAVVAALMAAFGGLAFLHLATPSSLLLTTFLLGGLWALNAPAWLAITPALVPRAELDGAIAAGNIGYNFSRVIGPTLGGLMIVALGVAAPFWAFAAVNLVAIAALLWWRPPLRGVEGLPAERLSSALRIGLRHAANSPPLRATMVRALAVYPFASAYLSLLPLIARQQVSQGPSFYGVVLGAISIGAVAGSFAIARLKARFGPDYVVALGSLGIVGALVLFGAARTPAAVLAAAVLGGAASLVVLACLYVSAQDSLPDWVRGRGLSIFLTVVFGALTIGGLAWGEIAWALGVPAAQYLAAAGALVALPLTWRWKLPAAAPLDLAPSGHWQAPTFRRKVENNEGPVMVSVDYRVDPSQRGAFVAALDELGRERRREGGFGWGLFEDGFEEGRFVETYLIESWLEFRHLRERVTNCDRVLEERVRDLLSEEPRVAFLIAPERRLPKRRVRHLGV
jgi:MFS family permease